jgi:hypothetical protein
MSTAVSPSPSNQTRRFAKAYLDVLKRTDLTPIDKLILSVIDLLSRKTGAAWPRADTIAAMLAINERSVRRSLKRLQSLDYVRITHRRDPCGIWHSNLYELTNAAHPSDILSVGQKAPLIEEENIYPSGICNEERTPAGPEGTDPTGELHPINQELVRNRPVGADTLAEPKAVSFPTRVETATPRSEAKGSKVVVETHSAPARSPRAGTAPNRGTAGNVAPTGPISKPVSTEDPVELLMSSAHGFLKSIAEENGVDAFDVSHLDWDIADRLWKKLARKGFGLADFERLYELYSSALKHARDHDFFSVEPRKAYTLAMLECLADGILHLVPESKIAKVRQTFEKYFPRSATQNPKYPRVWYWDEEQQLNLTRRSTESEEEWHQLPRGWKPTGQLEPENSTDLGELPCNAREKRIAPSRMSE